MNGGFFRAVQDEVADWQAGSGFGGFIRLFIPCYATMSGCPLEMDFSPGGSGGYKAAVDFLN